MLFGLYFSVLQRLVSVRNKQTVSYNVQFPFETNGQSESPSHTAVMFYVTGPVPNNQLRILSRTCPPWGQCFTFVDSLGAKTTPYGEFAAAKVPLHDRRKFHTGNTRVLFCNVEFATCGCPRCKKISKFGRGIIFGSVFRLFREVFRPRDLFFQKVREILD